MTARGIGTTGLELRHSTTTSRDVSRRGLAFRPAAPCSTGGQHPPPIPMMVGGDAMRDAQADVPSAKWLRAQLAFKDSMVHGILQFTPSIAFRYVLHRCESRDIRCRESFWFYRRQHTPLACPRTGLRGCKAIRLCIPWRFPRRGLVLFRTTSARRAPGKGGGYPRIHRCPSVNTSSRSSALQDSSMILPQVHLRKPCYDFSFL
jgi:hypothetical protein